MADVYTRIGYIKGATGATGAQGEKGDTGDAATIQVGSVTTVPYGQTANVVNSGTEQAAVFDFTIPQGRSGQQVTEMDNLLLNSITTSAAEFPLPAVGETGKVLWGKVVKWCSDMTALVATKLNAANVVNNLTTTASGYALDARQGKTLHDEVNGISSTFTFTNAVSNTTLTAESVIKYGGIYAVRLKIDVGSSSIPSGGNVADLTVSNMIMKTVIGDGATGSAAFTSILISATRIIIRNTGTGAMPAQDSAYVNLLIGV